MIYLGLAGRWTVYYRSAAGYALLASDDTASSALVFARSQIGKMGCIGNARSFSISYTTGYSMTERMAVHKGRAMRVRRSIGVSP